MRHAQRGGSAERRRGHVMAGGGLAGIPHHARPRVTSRCQQLHPLVQALKQLLGADAAGEVQAAGRHRRAEPGVGRHAEQRVAAEHGVSPHRGVARDRRARQLRTDALRSEVVVDRRVGRAHRSDQRRVEAVRQQQIFLGHADLLQRLVRGAQEHTRPKRMVAVAQVRLAHEIGHAQLHARVFVVDRVTDARTAAFDQRRELHVAVVDQGERLALRRLGVGDTMRDEVRHRRLELGLQRVRIRLYECAVARQCDLRRPGDVLVVRARDRAERFQQHVGDARLHGVADWRPAVFEQPARAGAARHARARRHGGVQQRSVSVAHRSSPRPGTRRSAPWKIVPHPVAGGTSQVTCSGEAKRLIGRIRPRNPGNAGLRGAGRVAASAWINAAAPSRARGARGRASAPAFGRHAPGWWRAPLP